MFTPKENPGYNQLTQDATGVIFEWLQNEWYETSAKDPLLLEEAPSSEDLPSPAGENVEKTEKNNKIEDIEKTEELI